MLEALYMSNIASTDRTFVLSAQWALTSVVVE
jgi:hypothetical protein